MPSILDLTLGALEIGTWLSVFLYGIITLQVYVYIQAEFKDHVFIQTLIAIMWIVDTVHTILLCIFIYHITVTQYGDPSGIDVIHWTYGGISILNGFMAVAVQSFFAYRIRIISGGWTISILSWLVSAVRTCFVILITIVGLKSKTFSEYLRRYEWTMPAGLSTMAIGDLLNTSALCFFLWRQRSEIPRHNRVINKIMAWSIETGLITSVCAITELILSIIMPRSLTWIGLYIFFPKFYSISFLSSLNNRPRLRHLDSAPSGDDAFESGMQFTLSRRRDTTHPGMNAKDSFQGDDWSDRSAAQKTKSVA